MTRNLWRRSWAGSPAISLPTKLSMAWIHLSLLREVTIEVIDRNIIQSGSCKQVLLANHI
jgi:hypothetical protein